MYPNKMFMEKRKLLCSSNFFHFWLGSIDNSNLDIGWLVGVGVGGILGKRSHEPHTGFS